MVGSPIGSAIGFPLSIFLVHAFGWRASFYVLGAFSLVIVMPLIFAVVRDWPPHGSSREVERRSVAQGYMAGARLFVHDYRFWLLVVFNSCVLIYLWGLNSWLPAYLQRAKHFNLTQVGIYSSLPFILMFLAVVGAGIVSDWLGRRAILCAIGLFGAGVFLYLGTIASAPQTAAVLIAVSAGFWGLVLPTQYAIAIEIIAPSVTSIGIGVYNGIGNLIGALAPIFMGWIIARTGSFDTGLLVLVFAAIFGACSILPLARRH
jgi:predicted MFS family arabinose efflux permease